METEWPFISLLTNLRLEFHAEYPANRLTVPLWVWIGIDCLPSPAAACTHLALSRLQPFTKTPHPTPPTGCNALTWNVSEGLSSVPGARYVLNVGVKPGSGLLVGAGGQSGAPAGGSSYEALEVIIGLQPRRYFSTMNETLDYSFLDTPLKGTAPSSTGAAPAAGPNAVAGGGTGSSSASGRRRLLETGAGSGSDGGTAAAAVAPVQQLEHQRWPWGSLRKLQQQPGAAPATNATNAPTAVQPVASAAVGPPANGMLVLRQRMPNPRMPAYVNGALTWGIPPDQAAAGLTAAAAAPPTPPPSPPAGAETLPPGSYCKPTPEGTTVCGVSMVYCCLGSGPLRTTIPYDWIERLSEGFTQPAGGEAAGGLPPPSSSNDSANVGTNASVVPPPLQPLPPAVALPPASAPGGEGEAGGTEAYVIVLATVLPVLALLLVAASWRMRRYHAAAAERKGPLLGGGGSGTGLLEQAGGEYSGKVSHRGEGGFFCSQLG